MTDTTKTNFHGYEWLVGYAFDYDARDTSDFEVLRAWAADTAAEKWANRESAYAGGDIAEEHDVDVVVVGVSDEAVYRFRLESYGNGAYLARRKSEVQS